jgi:hypothetical protein
MYKKRLKLFTQLRKVWILLHQSSRNSKQDMQIYNNVTLGRVPASIVAVEKQKELHILSVCL